MSSHDQSCVLSYIPHLQHSLTEKREMSMTCKQCISWLWARNVLKFRANQHKICRAYFTYFQCKVHVGEDDSIVARGARCESVALWLGFRERCTWFGLGKDSHRVKFLCLTHPTTLHPPTVGFVAL